MEAGGREAGPKWTEVTGQGRLLPCHTMLSSSAARASDAASSYSDLHRPCAQMSGGHGGGDVGLGWGGGHGCCVDARGSTGGGLPLAAPWADLALDQAVLLEGGTGVWGGMSGVCTRRSSSRGWGLARPGPTARVHVGLSRAGLEGPCEPRCDAGDDCPGPHCPAAATGVVRAPSCQAAAALRAKKAWLR